MKKNLNRIIALIVAAVLTMSQMSVPVYAEETAGSAEDIVSSSEETVLSSEETVSSSEDTVLSEEDPVSVSDETAAPADDETDTPEKKEEAKEAEDPELSEESEGFEFVPGYYPAPNEDKYENPADLSDEDSLMDELPDFYVSDVVQFKNSRNQNPFGTCWAFGSTAAVELSAAKNGITLPDMSTADYSLDLSELHLAYFCGKGDAIQDPLKGMNGDLNKRDPKCGYLDGGSAANAAHVLSCWMGAADETKYPYDNTEDKSKNKLPSYVISPQKSMDDVLHLKGFYTATPDSDAGRTALKNLIKEYGGATFSYWAADEEKGSSGLTEKDVRNTDNNCYYTPQKIESNHTVAVVGWNDSFSKDNFVTKPQGDGAWLIRNSWVADNTIINVDEVNKDITIPDGADYMSYFWLSYYDQSVGEPCYAFDMEKVFRGNKKHNYQYDGCMTSNSITNLKKYANIFKTSASDNEILDSVYFSTYSANVDYQVDIYKDVMFGQPINGQTPVATVTGKTTYAGGHTVTGFKDNKGNDVTFKKGDIFSVVITVAQSVEMEIEEASTEHYLTTAYTETGRSMTSADGNTWLDAGGTDGYGDLRIKAYTIDLPSNYETCLTLDANGGKFEDGFIVEEIEATVGEPYGELPVPYRDGYDFTGWLSEYGDPIDATTVHEGDIEAKAQWTRSDITVTFDANDGSWIDGSVSKKLVKGWNTTCSEDDLAGIGTPVYGGHKFAGWVDGEGKAYDFATALTQDVTVCAKWDEADDGFTVSGIEDEGYKYTGSAIKPVIRVFDGGVSAANALLEKTDFTVSYKNNTKAYTLAEGEENFDKNKAPTIIITGKGNYSKSEKRVYFKINPASVGNGIDFSDDFTVTIADKQFNNNKKQISKPTVKYGKLTLKEGTDYDLEFYDKDGKRNDEPAYGKVTVLVKAKGNYSDSAKVSYNIYKKNEDKNVTTAFVSKIPDRYYTGEVIDLDGFGKDGVGDIIVKTNSRSTDVFVRGGKSDDKGDYFIQYATGSNRVNVGTATIEIVGKDPCVGRKTATFKIVSKPITECSVDVSDRTYTGLALKPDVTVKDGDKVLTEGKDYSVSYSNNTKMALKDATKNAPTVTVRGKGNYGGTTSKKFSITERELSQADLNIYIPNIKAAAGKTVEAKSVKPTVTYYNPYLKKNVTLTKDRDYTIGFKHAAGNQLQTVDFTLKGCYKNIGEITGQFFIYPAQTTWDGVNNEEFKLSVADKGLVYTGSAIKPAITITRTVDGTTVKLVQGKDYTVSYNRNTNAADATPTNTAPTWKVTGTGAYKFTKTGTFNIVKKPLSDKDYYITVADVKWNGKDQKPAVKVIDRLTGKALSSSNYSVEYTSTKGEEKKNSNGIVTVTAKGKTGKGNYTGSLSPVIFHVYEKAITSAVFVKIEDKTFTGSAIRPKIVAYPDKNKTAGTELVEGDDYKLEYGPNNKAGTGTVIVKGKYPYGGTTTLKFKIKQKAVK